MNLILKIVNRPRHDLRHLRHLRPWSQWRMQFVSLHKQGMAQAGKGQIMQIDNQLKQRRVFFSYPIKRLSRIMNPFALLIIPEGLAAVKHLKYILSFPLSGNRVSSL